MAMPVTQPTLSGPHKQPLPSDATRAPTCLPIIPQHKGPCPPTESHRAPTFLVDAVHHRHQPALGFGLGVLVLRHRLNQPRVLGHPAQFDLVCGSVLVVLVALVGEGLKTCNSAAELSVLSTHVSG